MSKSSANWVYTYDADGLRTKRTNTSNGTTYEYLYSGGQLRAMKTGDTKMVFDYDANGLPLTVTYNGTLYYTKKPPR